jgi:hypothetical protein
LRAASRSNLIMSGIKTVRVRVVGLIFLLPSNTVSTATRPTTLRHACSGERPLVLDPHRQRPNCHSARTPTQRRGRPQTIAPLVIAYEVELHEALPDPGRFSLSPFVANNRARRTFDDQGRYVTVIHLQSVHRPPVDCAWIMACAYQCGRKTRSHFDLKTVE